MRTVVWDGTKEMKVTVSCHLPWTRRMSHGLDRHKTPENWQVLVVGSYSRIAFTNALSFCMTTFSATLTNLVVFLPQLRDNSLYLHRSDCRITLIYAHTSSRTHLLLRLGTLWHKSCYKLAALRGLHSTGDRWLKLKCGLSVGTYVRGTRTCLKKTYLNTFLSTKIPT
jgi:hypothetical protein